MTTNKLLRAARHADYKQAVAAAKATYSSIMTPAKAECDRANAEYRRLWSVAKAERDRAIAAARALLKPRRIEP